MAVKALRGMLAGLKDPAKDQAMAWWGLLCASLWDIAAHGLTWEKGIFVAALAGLRLVSPGLTPPPAPPAPPAPEV